MSTQENYLELQISYVEKNYEKIYNLLYMSGIENILEEDGFLKIYFPQKEKKEAQELAETLKEKFKLSDDSVSLKKFVTKNWNDEWENSIEPVYIKNKLVIYPSWKRKRLISPDSKILIEIDPKMSFGTGHNETTQLVLELLLDEIDEEDKYMLDFGCGTGILSIASIKLGMEKAIAIDIDDDSIENAKEYFRINGVNKDIKLIKGNISEIEEEGFDIICANIIRSVIEDNISEIHKKLKSGGKLFISGVLSDEEEKITGMLGSNGFEIKQINYKSEWIGLYAAKI